jgi:hypothetical protein
MRRGTRYSENLLIIAFDEALLQGLSLLNQQSEKIPKISPKKFTD